MKYLIILSVVLILNSCNSKVPHPYQIQKPSLLSIDTNKYEWAYDSAGNVLIYSTQHCDTVYIHDTIKVPMGVDKELAVQSFVNGWARGSFSYTKRLAANKNTFTDMMNDMARDSAQFVTYFNPRTK